MSEEDGFLGRWSRRKQEARREAQEPAAQEPSDPGEEQAGRERPEELPEPELPDPDTLGRDDDWSVFLRAGVPQALKRRALRRLWRLDPVLANLDGLNDYDEDFNRPEITKAVVRTLFKVGRGMVTPEMEEEERRKAGAAEAPALPSEEAARLEPGADERDEPQTTPEAGETAARALPEAGSEAAGEPEAEGPRPERRREKLPLRTGSGEGPAARRWRRFQVAQPEIGKPRGE